MPDRVLVVEDDRKIATAIHDGLQAEGYDVTIADTGPNGMCLASRQQYAVILLDRSLPGLDGLDLLRTVRAHGVRTPVIIVTARDSIEDRVEGLDAGADDYLVKPFAFEELLARMRTLLRCDRNSRSSEVCLSILDLEMDLVARTATRAGQLLSLTAKEFQVLAYLVHNAGTPVSRDTIAQQLWGGFHRSISLDNAIDVHIGRIRRKVDAEHPIKLIQTIRGLGFIVEPAPCGTHHV